MDDVTQFLVEEAAFVGLEAWEARAEAQAIDGAREEHEQAATMTRLEAQARAMVTRGSR